METFLNAPHAISAFRKQALEVPVIFFAGMFASDFARGAIPPLLEGLCNFPIKLVICGVTLLCRNLVLPHLIKKFALSDS